MAFGGRKPSGPGGKGKGAAAGDKQGGQRRGALRAAVDQMLEIADPTRLQAEGAGPVQGRPGAGAIAAQRQDPGQHELRRSVAGIEPGRPRAPREPSGSGRGTYGEQGTPKSGYSDKSPLHRVPLTRCSGGVNASRGTPGHTQ